MISNEYVTVFDLSQTGFVYGELLFNGLVFGLGGWFVLLVVKVIQSRPGLERVFNPFRSSKKMPKWVIYLIVAGTIILTILGSISYFQNQHLSKILRSGHASYVAGEIQNYTETRYRTHRRESFTVNGIYFTYPDFGLQENFNNTFSDRIPLENGTFVKVWYYEGQILKLMVRR